MMERFIMCCALVLYVTSDSLRTFAQANVTLASNNSCADGDTCFSELKADGELTTMTMELVENTTLTTIATASETVMTNAATLKPITNSSEVTNTSTTVEPTQPMSNTTDTVTEESTRRFDELCSCDLTPSACDINCCCDDDCCPADRAVFYECFRPPAPPPDPRYCHQSRIVYRNNSELRAEWSSGGLFCVVESNLPASAWRRDRPVVTRPEEFRRLRDGARAYAWPTHGSWAPAFNAAAEHKAGQLVWALKNITLDLFGVPTRVAGSLCQASKPVRFLGDVSSSCSRMSPTADDCQSNADYDAASYYKHWSIVSSSDADNLTRATFTPEDCVNTSCVQVTAFLCRASDGSDLSACQAADIPRPQLDKATCRNVLRQIRYVVRHNGTQGITNVSAYITLTSVPPSPQHQFVQDFLVHFLWASLEHAAPGRSGRPGYVVGKPLLAGVKVKNPMAKERNATEAIQLSNDPSDWLGLPAVAPGGLCDESRRDPVVFGEDLRAVCLLPLGASDFSTAYNCELAQRRALAVLGGAAAEGGVLVGTYGDARGEEPGDWVRVMLENVPQERAPCKVMVTSLHVDVVFAQVGALARPQAKILGVALRFGPPRDLACRSRSCPIQLTTSVSFVDVTQPALTHFAQPPVYEVKLPHDFFYPFFSSSVVPSRSNCLLLTALVVFSCLSL